jgi:hypothetical protein
MRGRDGPDRAADGEVVGDGGQQRQSLLLESPTRVKEGSGRCAARWSSSEKK